MCVCVVGVGYTCNEVSNPLLYTVLPFFFFLGAGESGKSTIVKQMK